jgi:hypothetical protein
MLNRPTAGEFHDKIQQIMGTDYHFPDSPHYHWQPDNLVKIPPKPAARNRHVPC